MEKSSCLNAQQHLLTFGLKDPGISAFPVAYRAIVRSLENFPEPATFKIALRAHALRSAYNAVSRWSASIGLQVGKVHVVVAFGQECVV